MTTDTITMLRVDQLHESPFNPRKIFDEAALQELSTDIKAQGRVLSPLLVRPRIGPLFAGDPEATAGHEIVFGHRRYRASELAGLLELPCMVRSMSDDEARRAQISENLQRKDVHPIEEAEGFQALIDNDGESADTIAEKFGKSRSYVYGRLKLLEACPEIRKACLAGEIGSEVALLVARLRTVKLQEKALGYIRADWRAKLDDGGKASYRHIRDLLTEKFTLDLKSAMFDIEDEMLLPLAGNCVTCPKRSANAPEYADLVENTESRHGNPIKGSANACTDPDCFDAKKKAHLKREADKLSAKGEVVVQGNAARSSVSAHGEVKGAYIALKDVQAELKKLPRKGIEGDANQPKVVLIQDPRTGKTHKAVKVADVKAAGVKVKEAPKSHSDNYAQQQQQKWAEERAAKDAKAKAERIVRLALLKRITDAMTTTARDAFDLQLIARAAWAGVEYHAKEVLAEIHDAKSGAALSKLIGQMDTATLTTFLMQCALINDVAVRSHDLTSKPTDLLDAAEHYGVNVGQLRAELTGVAPTPALAARADKKANAGANKAAPAAVEAWDKAFPKPKGKSKAKEQKDDAGVAGGSAGQADLLEEAMP